MQAQGDRYQSCRVIQGGLHWVHVGARKCGGIVRFMVQTVNLASVISFNFQLCITLTCLYRNFPMSGMEVVLQGCIALCIR